MDLNTSSEVNDALVNSVDEDPLTDPLAFDHDYTAALQTSSELDVSYPELKSPRRNSNAITVEFEDDEDEEEEEDDSGEIVFVDINRLKAQPQPQPSPSSLQSPTSQTRAPVRAKEANPELFPKDDHSKPGVEKPGTGTASSPDDTDASRSDGSDSGLGSDILNTPATEKPDSGEHPTPLPVPELTITTNESYCDGGPSHHVHSPACDSPALTPDLPSSSGDFVDKELLLNLPPPRSALKRVSLEDTSAAVEEKRTRRTVQFDSVTIFYFARIQGFLCVPSVGGCTLGMEARHMYEKTMTLNEHVAEQRRALRLQLELLNPNTTRSQQQQLQSQSSQNHNNNNNNSSSDSSDDEASSASDLDAELTGFLRPIGTKQRRAMLKAAGVRRIEASEKDECRIIRDSREVCGCRCPGGYCDPDLCYCSINNIKCQVDRPNYPCSCTGDCCGNQIGRVEFNPGRVRTHYIHTKMRLELEEKQQRLDSGRMSGGDQDQRCSSEVVAVGLRAKRHTAEHTVYYDQVESSRDFVDYRRPFETTTREIENCLSQQAVVSVTPFGSLAASSSNLSLSSNSPSNHNSNSSNVNISGSRTDPMSTQSILSRNSSSSSSCTSDYQRSFLSTLDTARRPVVISEISPAAAASLSTADSRPLSNGSQFCNNILQILGIQSPTPPPPTVSAVANNNPVESYPPASADHFGADALSELRQVEDAANNNRELAGSSASKPSIESNSDSRPFVEMPHFNSSESIKVGNVDLGYSSSSLPVVVVNGANAELGGGNYSDWSSVRDTAGDVADRPNADGERGDFI